MRKTDLRWHGERRRRWLILLVLSLVGFGGANASSSALRGGSLQAYSSSDDAAPTPWPRHRKLLLDGNSTTNKWTIMFREDRGKVLRRILPKRAKVLFDFHRVLNAVVVSDLSNDVLNWLLKRDEVLIIEQEQRVHSLETNVTQTLKDGQPWGIDLTDGLRDGKFTYTWTGQGVNIYIFDTGIQINHNEFTTASGGSRASCGFDVFDDDQPDDGSSSNPLCVDEKGHGTHIGATAAGSTYGIAKGANLVAVRCLDAEGNGSTNGVIKGLDYVAEQKAQNPNTPMIVNLSLGTGVSASMNAAIDRLSDLGVIVVGASGNEGVDACTTSPASAEKCIVVGAINSALRRPNWSNFGGCVDLHAPGQDILSAFSDPKDRRKTFVRTGTSMAVPHAVGVIAMYLQWNPKLTHAQILDYIRRDGTPNSIFGLINSANVLLNSTAIRRRIALPPAATPIAINVPAPAPAGDGTSSRPTLSPIARETGPTPPSDNREKCNIIFSKCEEDKDCCLKTCRQFGEVLDRRCFFF